MLQLDTGIPYLHDGSSFRPICSHCFHDGVHGAVLFCRKLGYDSGSIIDPEYYFYENVVDVGVCLDTDKDLISCSGVKCHPSWCNGTTRQARKIECTGGIEKKLRLSCSLKGKQTLGVLILVSCFNVHLKS